MHQPSNQQNTNAASPISNSPERQDAVTLSHVTFSTNKEVLPFPWFLISRFL